MEDRLQMNFDQRNFSLADAKKAAEDIFSNGKVSFEEIKARPWYKSLLGALTFHRNDKTLILKNIRDLADLQKIFMEVYSSQIKNVDGELDTMVESIIQTQEFARKLYNYSVLGIQQQASLDDLSDSDQEMLLLFLDEFDRDGQICGERKERLQRYNRGIAHALRVHRPDGMLDLGQLRKVQTPAAFYRCAWEQSVVIGTAISSCLEEDLNHLELSPKTRSEIEAAVRREANSYGADHFFEKYLKSGCQEDVTALDETSLEFEEESGDVPQISEEVPDGNSSKNEIRGSQNFEQLSALIRKYTESKKFGKPLLGPTAWQNMSKKADLASKVLPYNRIAAKAVVEIVATQTGHLVFTTAAMYWAVKDKINKIKYSEIQPNTVGTQYKNRLVAVALMPSDGKQFEIEDTKVDGNELETLLRAIQEIDCFAEDDGQMSFVSYTYTPISIAYLQIIAEALRNNGYPLHEAYRLTCKYGMSNFWSDIDCNTDVPLERMIAEWMLQLPYPNEETLCINLAQDICRVLQYTKNSEILTAGEKKYFALLLQDTSYSDTILRHAQLGKRIIEESAKDAEISEVVQSFETAMKDEGNGMCAFEPFMPMVIENGNVSFPSGKKAQRDALKWGLFKEEAVSYDLAVQKATEAGELDIAEELKKSLARLSAKSGLSLTSNKMNPSICVAIRSRIRQFIVSEDKLGKMDFALSPLEKQHLAGQMARLECDYTGNNIVGVYNGSITNTFTGSYSGFLFLSEGFCFRKSSASEARYMPYSVMGKVERKLSTIVVHSTEEPDFVISGLPYVSAKIFNLLTDISHIITDTPKE